jgi:hypothetical protein
VHCLVSRVGQNHTFIGIYGVYTVFLAGESPYIWSYTMCIYGVYIRFWPTLLVRDGGYVHCTLRDGGNVHCVGSDGGYVHCLVRDGGYVHCLGRDGGYVHCVVRDGGYVHCLVRDVVCPLLG